MASGIAMTLSSWIKIQQQADCVVHLTITIIMHVVTKIILYRSHNKSRVMIQSRLKY